VSTTVDPSLRHEIAQFGCGDFTQCINCGNCTAVCSLSEGDVVFPRKTIRYVQLGLRDKLVASAEPWLCYYCGECTDTCPRQANPGEIMMTVRRWLTAQYDRSGKAARFYGSNGAMWAAVVQSGLIPAVLLGLYHVATRFENVVTDRVALNSFAPVAWVWAIVLIHFAVLGWRVASNAAVMWRSIVPSGGEPTPRPVDYAAELGSLAVHFLTQRRWRDCGREHQGEWLVHWMLVSGYLVMLTLVVGLLGWFQTDAIHPLHHPQRWLGYYATAALVGASVIMLVGRSRKRAPRYRFSEPSDWLFPAFLLIGAITGILVHLFRYAGWPWPTYGMYTVHVMAVVAMLDSEVGVGKWTHMVYRPWAHFLRSVQKRAQERLAGAGGGS
jgi:ferredoxin